MCATSTTWRDIASLAVAWSGYGLSGCISVYRPQQVCSGVIWYQWVWHGFRGCGMVWDGLSGCGISTVGLSRPKWMWHYLCGCGMALMVVSRVLHGLSKCDVPSLGATCPR